MRSIATKIMIFISVTTILFSAFLLNHTYSITKKQVNEAVETQAAMALQFDLAIRKYVAHQIRPRMYKLLKEDEFIPETMSTSYVARDIFEDVRDITQRKKAEEIIQDRNKFQGVLEMAGAVSHELNQPMQVVSIISEMLMADFKQDNSNYENIKTIKEQTMRMGTITEKLMRVTRYETKDYLKGKIIDIDRAVE